MTASTLIPDRNPNVDDASPGRRRLATAAATTALMLACSPATPADRDAPSQLAHGAYLVERVGMCNDCHTPFGQAAVPGRLLSGAPIGFAPLSPMPDWANIAPPIAGKAYSREHLFRLLTTGKRPDGSAPRPPMPPYGLSAADADAVIAYLHSLRARP